jgi:hypothetical protein
MLELALLHQGEELLIPLPFAMLVVAYLLMKWAGKGEAKPADAEEPDAPSPAPDYTTPTFD